MFNPADLDHNQKRALIESIKQTKQNPFAMLKLKLLGLALDIKRYVESNAQINKNDFQLVWQGFEQKATAECDRVEQELVARLTNELQFADSSDLCTCKKGHKCGPCQTDPTTDPGA